MRLATLRGWAAGPLLLSLSGLAVGSLAQAAEAPPCQPAARLDGPEAVVAPIGRVLRQRGIAARARAAGCRQVAVEVRSSGTGFDLVILDPEGRTARRQLPTAESAALVIESWTRGDLAAPLPEQAPPASDLDPLALPLPSAESARSESDDGATPPTPPPSRERPAAPEAEPRSRSDVDGDVGVGARAEPPRLAGALVAASLLSVAVTGENGIASDKTSWWGASAGVCLRTGPLCTGVLARYAQAQLAPTTEAGASLGASSGSSTFLARNLEGHLTTQAPLHFGRWVLVPSIGIGAGRITTPAAGGRESAPLGLSAPHTRDGKNGGNGGPHDGQRHDDHPRSPGATATPDSPPMTSATTNTVADEATAIENRLLGQAGLILSLPIYQGFALDLGVSGALALARWGEGAGPGGQLRGGLGLRYGGL